MNELIDEFVKKVLSTDESFLIQSKDNTHKLRYTYFVQGKVGDGKYIYGEWSYDNENFYSDIGLKLGLAAVVVKEKVVIVDDFVFGLSNSCFAPHKPLPENVYHVRELIKEENKKGESVFRDFYEALPVKEITDVNTIQDCKDEARNRLLTRDDAAYAIPSFEPMFCAQDIVDSLCGLVDLKEEAVRALEEDRQRLVDQKAFYTMVAQFVKDRSVVEPYELEIVKGVKSVNAKAVNVEFEMNGKRMAGTVPSYRLLSVLWTRNCFSDCCFRSAVRGSELLGELGAATSKRKANKKELLTCKHITRITYGKKVLYSRTKTRKSKLREEKQNETSQNEELQELS